MMKMALNHSGQKNDFAKYSAREQILNIKSINRFRVLHCGAQWHSFPSLPKTSRTETKKKVRVSALQLEMRC